MATSSFSVHLVDASISDRLPFIYGVFVVSYRSLYVGQTYGRGGALARLAQHLTDDGNSSLLARLALVRRLEKVRLTGEKISFIAFALPNHKAFSSSASEHREAIEFLVWRGVIEYVTDQRLDIGVISIARNNPYSETRFIKSAAQSALDAFQSWLHKISK